MSEQNERVGFVGLGIMGAGMAGNLLRKGFDVVVHNRTAARTEPLVAEGATAAATPREVAEQCDVVFICVSDTPDVEQVLFGEDGIAAGVRDGALVVDSSTVSPASTREWAGRLAERGVGFLDAPVSGGSEGAAKGTLSIMVGGDDAQVERARPYLEAMGSTVTHVGVVGAGQTCKLVNQILVVTSMLGVSEALVLAKAGGLDLEKTITAVEGGAAGSWMLANRGPQVIRDDWRPGFTIDLQQKDLRLVLEAADELGVPALATSTIFHLYRTLQRDGLGGEGNHALIKALERLAGVQARQEDGDGQAP
ncbi:NAD(P)-dependent oxidoreductase [Actinopolymorpha sp. NPDC004070]|uniref:NAD(P)-dependent oxidoreductase n=1 Tax=Actinopolymorpha sp. NPDC004070 TaxID=3154548 RepID=UPI0033AF1EF5